MALEVEINDRKLQLAIKLAPKILKIQLADGFDLIGRRFLKRFRQERLQGPPGVRGGSAKGLFGTFRRASIVSPTIEGMGLEIYTDSKVAALHETGGKVSNPSGAKLAVPLSSQKELFTSSGKLKKQYKRVRDIKNIKPVELNGKPFLVRFKKGIMTPLFVLKKSVTIKPRLEFYKTWDKLANDRINVLNQKVKIALEKL